MNYTELFQTYLRHYGNKDLEAISAMYADDIHLRDWNISVHGKAAVMAETAKNFAEAQTLAVMVMALYENANTVAGEVYIHVNGLDLYVVDIMKFDANGKITAIRSYKGRGG